MIHFGIFTAWFIRIFIAAMVLSAAVYAQRARDEWRNLNDTFRFEASGAITLDDVRISDEDRALLTSLIAGSENDRRTALTAHIGTIELAPGRPPQIIVKDPQSLCGATGNCRMWILIRENGRLRPILQAGGNSLLILDTMHGPFHDIATTWHISASDLMFDIEHWDGHQYRRTDCYIATFDANDNSKPPRTETCPAK